MRYKWPGGEFDPVARALISGDRIVQLTPKESDCLYQLAFANGRVVSTTDLSGRVWHHEIASSTGTYQQAVRSLRKKLRLTPLHITVETVRKTGYRLVVYDDGPVQSDKDCGAAP